MCTLRPGSHITRFSHLFTSEANIWGWSNNCSDENLWRHLVLLQLNHPTVFWRISELTSNFTMAYMLQLLFWLGFATLSRAHLVQSFPWPPLHHHVKASHWAHSHNTPGRQNHIFMPIIQGLSFKNPLQFSSRMDRKSVQVTCSPAAKQKLELHADHWGTLTAPASHSLWGTCCSITVGFISGINNQDLATQVSLLEPFCHLYK